MRGQRHDGPGGGMIGGPTGIGRGSPLGAGVSRLNGVMMMGGMAGGAEGGSFGPPDAWATSWKALGTADMGSP